MSVKVCIIIPCFNEQAVLRDTVNRVLAIGLEVVIVDDGSSQPAAALLGDLPIHLLRHPINLGQGAALQTGMDFAVRQGAEAVVHFDADGQHRVEDIQLFLDALTAGADVALGSRFLRHQDSAGIPLPKRLLLQCARLVNLFFTGLWLSDAHNGFRALNRRALQSIHLYENRMAHASEILQQIRRQRLQVVEIPTHIIYSDYSQAKGQRLINSLNILLDLLVNKFLR